MVVVKLISGLGNQLFQYALGRQISLFYNVPLKLDLSFFETQRLRSYKLDRYPICAGIATNKDIEKLTWIHKGGNTTARICRKVSNYLPKRKRHYFKEDSLWVFEKAVLESGPNVYLDGYWQHHSYFNNFDNRILQELTLNSFSINSANDLAQKILDDKNSVSIHVRRGDYVTDPDAYRFLGVLPEEYYQRAAAVIMESVPNPVFYIFSDDQDWVKQNLKLIGTMVFVDVQANGQDYIELELMSKCAHNIIANSSFSWWAAFKNTNPGKIVIAPRKWVVPEDVNERIKLQFPEWIKL